MGTPLFHVDAFADGPFTGNPAAVCVMGAAAGWEAGAGEGRGASWMQRVAQEMNLSETAFVSPVGAAGEPVERGEGAARWRLRWFTPAAEVELCGHATLASAHLLWESGRAASDEAIVFETVYRGELTCRLDAAGRIAMDFPADAWSPAEAPPGLIESLGVEGDRVRQVSRGRYDWLIELDAADAVIEARPAFERLRRFESRGFALTAWARGEGAGERAEGGEGADVVSRFFAPSLRVDEDPVTGSLHCLLGPYWRDRRGAGRLSAYQASRRGGRLSVTCRGDRVELAGRAVTVARGELLH